MKQIKGKKAQLSAHVMFGFHIYHKTFRVANKKVIVHWLKTLYTIDAS